MTLPLFKQCVLALSRSFSDLLYSKASNLGCGGSSGFEGKTLRVGIKTSPLYLSFRFRFRPFDFFDFLVELSPSWKSRSQFNSV